MIFKDKIRHRASQISGAIRLLDFFKQPVPSFNIEGKESEGTLLGSMITISLIIVMFLYGMLKFDILVNRLNPNITLAQEP